MSSSTSTPTDVQATLFGVDMRFIPIIAALVAFAVFTVLVSSIVVTIVHIRRLGIVLGAQQHETAIRRRRPLDPEEEYVPKPLLRTVDIDLDLEIGESWSDLSPLSAEWSEPARRGECPPPYKSDASPPKYNARKDRIEEDKYIRLTVLVALPNGRRRTKDDVIIEACVPTTRYPSESTAVEDVLELPETTFGVANENVTL